MRIALIAAQCHGASRGGAAVGRAPRSRRGRRRPCGAVRARRAGDPRAPRPRPLRPPALHDRAPGGLLPPGAPRRRRPERRLGGAAGEARPARPRARRPLPRARGRERPRRPRGRRALGRRLLRQEHPADHAPSRLLGGARHARHGGGARADAAARRRLRLLPPVRRRLPDGRARRARHARRHPLPRVLDAGPGADPARLPRGARRAGVRLRRLPGRLPLEPRDRAPARGRTARRRRACRPGRVARGRPRRLRAPVRAAARPALAPAERPRRGRQRRRSPGAAATRGRAPRARWGPDARRARALGARADGGAGVALRRAERWIAAVRVAAVPFAIFQVAVSTGEPASYQRAAWVTTGVFAVAAAALYAVARAELSPRGTFALALGGQLLDTALVSAYVVEYSPERATLTPEILFVPLVEGCVRFATLGGVLTALASAPVMVAFEKLRADRLGLPFRSDFVTLHVGLEVLIALIVGWLVARLAAESADARSRAAEATELRDELARRVDLLEAANRCARALGSSLELPEAFGGFIRELRGLVPFDRVEIVLAESGGAQVMAAAGPGTDAVFPAGAH